MTFPVLLGFLRVFSFYLHLCVTNRVAIKSFAKVFYWWPGLFLVFSEFNIGGPFSMRFLQKYTVLKTFEPEKKWRFIFWFFRLPIYDPSNPWILLRWITPQKITLIYFHCTYKNNRDKKIKKKFPSQRKLQEMKSLVPRAFSNKRSEKNFLLIAKQISIKQLS